MGNPLISAIIPVYNGEKYIENIFQCLEKQTLQDFEVIFINDGSKDNSKLLLEEYCKKNLSKYRLILQENKGVSAARNNGIKNSTGSYICFIDVDDSIHEYYFEMLYKSLNNKKNVVSFCNTADCYKNINKVDFDLYIYTNQEALKKYLYREITPVIWGMIIHRVLLNKNDISFKEGYKYSEDMHMVWKIFNYAQEVHHIESPLYIYNENEGSAMTKIDESRLDSICLMKDIELFFKDNNKYFYPLYKKYGVPRASWSLLWQVAHYKGYKEFKEYVKIYDFKRDLIKLRDFKDKKVALLSQLFLFSTYLYYIAIKILTKQYRS